MSSLADQHAAPDGTAPRLTDEQIQRLLPEVPGWNVEDGKLVREMTVGNFQAALDLVNEVGRLAEEENHHPDLCILAWNHVRIALYTHTAGGLSQNDFIMAAKFSKLFNGGVC